MLRVHSRLAMSFVVVPVISSINHDVVLLVVVVVVLVVIVVVVIVAVCTVA